MPLNIFYRISHNPTGTGAQAGQLKQLNLRENFKITNADNASSIRKYTITGAATTSVDVLDGDYLSVSAIAVKCLGEDPILGGGAHDAIFLGSISTELPFRLDPGESIAFKPSAASPDALFFKTVSGATAIIQVMTWGLSPI